MPYRKVILASEQLYHIFNRGVARQPTFSSKTDYQHFLDLIDYYRFVEAKLSYSAFKKLKQEDRESLISKLRQSNNLHVEILVFCLMPNHFHFLIKQITSNGTTIFLSKLQNAYAKYFNIKEGRTGSLWGSEFQAVRIETDEQLLHVSRYIHLNPSTGYLVSIENLLTYPWSSFPNYIGLTNNEFVNKSLIMSFFKDSEAYKEFVFNQAEYQRQLHHIKHLTLE